MIPSNENRRDLIAGPSGQRDTIRQKAHARSQDNFGRFLSDGPFGGVKVIDNSATTHVSNGDEALDHFAGNFTKGLEHDAITGFVDTTADYQGLSDALESVRSNESFPDPAAMNTIDGAPRANSVTSSDARPFVNPLAAVAAGGTGIDSYDVSIPPAPKLKSRQAGIEIVELYWMTLLRDIPFDEWENAPLAQKAVAELHQLNQTPALAGEEQFAQHYTTNQDLTTDINMQRLFRGSAPGDDIGPYISQFLIKDVQYGTLTIEQVQKRLKSDADYMDNWQSWLEVQNGLNTGKDRKSLEVKNGLSRHILTLRDLAHYVHFDALHEAYFNAALILDELGVPLSSINPYTTTEKQEGFGVLGGPHLFVAVTEAATRALRAIWHQKWMIHRRLRPEAMGARVEYQHLNPMAGLVDDLVLNSSAANMVIEKQGNALLSQAFPEGSPMHPSYGAGHATVAGACTTILKAFFETDGLVPTPQQAVLNSKGSTILADLNEDLTVVGEINKLAANIAIGRDGAGVHYRTDYTKSLTLGEAVAMALLQEQAMELKEGQSHDAVAFKFENFSGQQIEIAYSGEIRSPGPGIRQAAKDTKTRAKGIFADY